MTLTNDERDAVVSFRLQKAKDTLTEAEGIATLGYWNAVTNRLYYACYYITSALLIKNNYSAHTHSGIIHLLGLHFIKSGVVSKDAGRLYSKLFELGQTGDYDDLFNLSEEDVKPLIPLAKSYFNELTVLINESY
jgi:uncharacterized protein (UPF0332 family)